MSNRYNRAALAILEVLGDRVDYVQYQENRYARRWAGGVATSVSELGLILTSDDCSNQAYLYIDLSDDPEELSSEVIIDLSMTVVARFLEEDDCRRCGRGYSESQKEEILANAKSRLAAALGLKEVRHG